MQLVSALDWTLLINTTIITIGTIANGFGVVWIVRKVKTPSGDSLGAVAERTEHLASASVMQTSKLLRDLEGDTASSDDGETTAGETAG